MQDPRVVDRLDFLCCELQKPLPLMQLTALQVDQGAGAAEEGGGARGSGHSGEDKLWIWTSLQLEQGPHGQAPLVWLCCVLPVPVHLHTQAPLGWLCCVLPKPWLSMPRTPRQGGPIFLVVVVVGAAVVVVAALPAYVRYSRCDSPRPGGY